MAETSCPFVGLGPFTAAESRFFFGRERETRLVINNLFASRLTLLYGPSGVGKSSLLGAGVTPQLAAEAREDGRPEQLIVYLKEWQGDVMARFRGAVEKAVSATWPEADVPEAGGMGLAGWLGAIAEEREVEILVLLDQFEEYFLYQPEETAVVREPFAPELAAALGQAMLDWRERRVAEEQRAEIRRWRRLVAALVVMMVVALVAVGVAWMKSTEAEENARKAEDNAAREREAKLDAQESARRATTKANEVLNLTQQFQMTLAEKEEKEAQLLEAQGKSAEAEKLRADSAAREQELERQLEVLRPPEMANDIGMRFRRIRAGTFQMGSPPEELARDDDETLHKVTLTLDFWMAETEVTQGQWNELIRDNPSRFRNCGADCPVERVNWFEALEFANRLSEREGLGECYTLTCSGTFGENFACSEVDFVGLDCRGYRLPTESEWEYAARAGTTTAFWTGDNLTTGQANYDGNFPYGEIPKGVFRETPVATRSFDPNPWGLYEVHGNVWEWVWDWYRAVSGNSVIDPTGREYSSGRVLRGGGWHDPARHCRAADRVGRAPGSRHDYVGFRLVRTYP
ncbi:MAG: SUMF1/EgtB/PvdO family nonheme iron enzyme [bacterium]|nr:SUMF1/EgtB/PvdO family nonheme iron enzyme [bacterium]